MLDEKAELIRLANAQEVMYGNKDKGKVFPIDSSKRLTHYTIYVERRKYNDEIGEIISLKTTRRYIQPSIKTYEEMYNNGKFWERYKGLVVTILHDPLEQANLEGVSVQSGKIKDNSKLRELIGKAKTADEFAPKVTASTTKKGGASV